MKAAFYEKTGGPEVIQYGELPKPKAQGAQVLVRVEAAGMNPIDTYIRSGLAAPSTPFPLIPGFDLAGTVEAVGPEARAFRVGDRVWGSNQSIAGRQGTFAEYVATDESLLYVLPANVAMREAAAIALTGITAYVGLFQKAYVGQGQGEAVFINGGSGGVGSLAIQMAKARGARVATSAGNAHNVKLCEGFGADLALNYKSDDVAEAVKKFAPAGLSVWFEMSREPNFEVILPLMAKGGRIVILAGRSSRPVLPLGPFYTRDLSVIGFAMFNTSPELQRTAAEEINCWMGEGKLKAHIGKVMKMSEAAAAHQLQEENTGHGKGTLSGKIVLEP